MTGVPVPNLSVFTCMGCCCRQQVEAAYQHVRGDWEAAAACREPVLESALAASTTDNEHQTIGEQQAGMWPAEGGWVGVLSVGALCS